MQTYIVTRPFPELKTEDQIYNVLGLHTNQLDGVDVVALEPLPDADLGVGAAQADDVARRVHERRHPAVVRQDGVGARAGQQVPQADHPVLKFMN